MNNTFNFKRFMLLFKKHSLEHAKTYLLSTAVLAGILLLVMALLSYNSKGRMPEQIQAIVFLYFILGAGSIFTSLSFIDLGDKRKATRLLTLPASHFEKFLVSWIYSYVIFQLVFIGVFYLIDCMVIALSVPPLYSTNQLMDIFNGDDIIKIAFIAYAVFHAFFIWGAIVFEKLHFIKTAFVFFIYIILLIIINEWLLHSLTGNKSLDGVPFTTATFLDGKNIRVVMAIGMRNTNWIVLAITVIIFWLSAFFRLKEKEI